MNKLREKWYLGDSRYEKVLEQMQLLGIQDVTTMRQHKNGTIVWKLPIKDADSKLYIEVASFKSGYVRNQGISCHSNYQLNKRIDSEPQYYEFGRCNNGNGDKIYRKFTTRTCKLIPKEIDRLEYLIRYCLKNYYIKHANLVPNGEYVAKWMYDDGQRYGDDKVKDLEEDLENMTEARDYYKDKYEKLNDFYEASTDFNNSMLEGMVPKWKYDEAIDLGRTNAEAEALSDCGHYERIRDLENKLDTIQRISNHG